ncbi:hypothetical protein D3C71_880290 [compost metagenome]
MVLAVLAVGAVAHQVGVAHRIERTFFGHARLVAQTVVHAEITVGPVDVQVGTDAPVRILVEVATGTAVDRSIFGGLGVPLGQIGAVPADGELAERGFRQLVQDAHIPAFHLVRGQVLQRHVDVGDGIALGRGAVGRVAGDQAAVGCLFLR